MLQRKERVDIRSESNQKVSMVTTISSKKGKAKGVQTMLMEVSKKAEELSGVGVSLSRIAFIVSGN